MALKTPHFLRRAARQASADPAGFAINSMTVMVLAAASALLFCAACALVARHC